MVELERGRASEVIEIRARSGMLPKPGLAATGYGSGSSSRGSRRSPCRASPGSATNAFQWSPSPSPSRRGGSRRRGRRRRGERCGRLSVGTKGLAVQVELGVELSRAPAFSTCPHASSCFHAQESRHRFQLGRRAPTIVPTFRSPVRPSRRADARSPARTSRRRSNGTGRTGCRSIAMRRSPRRRSR